MGGSVEARSKFTGGCTPNGQASEIGPEDRGKQSMKATFTGKKAEASVPHVLSRSIAIGRAQSASGRTHGRGRSAAARWRASAIWMQCVLSADRNRGLGGGGEKSSCYSRRQDVERIQDSRAELQAGEATLHLGSMTALSFLNLDENYSASAHRRGRD